MFQTLKNAWKTAELKSKLLFTLLIVILYRLGSAIPVPWVAGEVGEMFTQANFAVQLLAGDAFSKATLFALSVSPYITSSIVMQLLTIAIPALERLSKEGEEGKKKINSITRIVTVALALITSIGYYQVMKSYQALTRLDLFSAIVIVACYCAGASLIMWLAEKINESGIGNGISLILFINIIATVPTVIGQLWALILSGWLGIVYAVLTVVFTVAAIGFIVWMTNSERRIPVQYAKKVVGRKMYGGQGTNLPIKLNMTGVMPIIFASSIVSLPATIGAFFPAPAQGTFWRGVLDFFSYQSPVYAILFFVLIIAFAYFYVSISFNPIEVANNLKNNGGSIPGIRPGKPTSDYITKILNRITLLGALLLSVIAVLPLVINMVSVAISGGTAGMTGLAFGGSSLIIVVGVVLETIRDIEAQMTLRHYKGFLE